MSEVFGVRTGAWGWKGIVGNWYLEDRSGGWYKPQESVFCFYPNPENSRTSLREATEIPRDRVQAMGRTGGWLVLGDRVQEQRCHVSLGLSMNLYQPRELKLPRILLCTNSGGAYMSQSKTQDPRKVTDAGTKRPSQICLHVFYLCVFQYLFYNIDCIIHNVFII